METFKISSHPTFIANLNESNLKELTSAIQSSKVFRFILSNENIIIKNKADIFSETGVLGKSNVCDYKPVTIDTVKNTIKLKSLDGWNNIIDPELQKKIALKTLYASFYKKDLILDDSQVKKSLDFNSYIEKLYYIYKNNELTDNTYDVISYLLKFFTINDITLSSVKQKIWNHLFEI